MSLTDLSAFSCWSTLHARNDGRTDTQPVKIPEQWSCGPSFGITCQKKLSTLITQFSSWLWWFILCLLYVLRGFTYYKMANLDNRIANADQLLTQDVEKLSNCIGELYSNLSKVWRLYQLWLSWYFSVADGRITVITLQCNEYQSWLLFNWMAWCVE
jgi:hypothetical protein